MGWLRNGYPFLSARATAIASLLLTCTSAIKADANLQARFRGTGKADPIRIENVHVTNSPAAGQTAIAYDLAWDHSWREAWEVPEQECALFYAHVMYNRAQDQKWEGKPPLKLENWEL